MQFPVIIKPRKSSVVPYSHDLIIVRDKVTLIEKVLPLFSYLSEDTIIVQHFILDHHESLIKVYAIGNQYDLLTKRTFPK